MYISKSEKICSSLNPTRAGAPFTLYFGIAIWLGGQLSNNQIVPSMPLVERYNDWKITNTSFDDPHTLRFDHRLEADEARHEAGLANVEE